MAGGSIITGSWPPKFCLDLGKRWYFEIRGKLLNNRFVYFFETGSKFTLASWHEWNMKAKFRMDYISWCTLVPKKISFILSNLLLYFRDKNRYFTTIILSIVICSTAIAVDKKSQIISKINGVIRPILQCPIYVT